MTVQLPRSPFMARHFSEYATNQASEIESVNTSAFVGTNPHLTLTSE